MSKPVIVCELCKNKHNGTYASGRFCSSKCAKSFSTSKNRKEINLKVSKKLKGPGKKCKTCGTGFRPLRDGHGGINCIKCKGNSRKTSFHLLKTDKAKKLRLIKRRTHRCEMCKNDKHMGFPIPLELDHIDGDSSNSSITNLRLLCPNCHTFTPTYKAKNKGNVKGKRKLFYKTYPIKQYRPLAQ